MIQILIVDDNENTRKLMKVVLSKHDYETSEAGDGIEALEVLADKHIDLILLDVMMPNMDGYEFLNSIRESGNKVPVLMVSAKDAPSDRIKGFVLGTDDYMVKPFNEEELVLRIQALLRRAKLYSDRELKIGKSVLREDSFEIEENGNVIVLPKKEFQLLYKLLSNANKTYTRQQLMDEFWSMDTDSMEHTVDVHISRIRDKLKTNESFEIVTVRGLGYKAVIL